MTPTKAYSAAGFVGKGAAQSASRLAKDTAVAARIAELRNNISRVAMERTLVDREYVIRRLKENVERSMQAEPVRDRSGKETGRYTYDGSVANRALELLGKELGMFRDAIDHTTKNLDPSKWTKVEIEQAIKALEEQTFGDDVEAAAAAREAAIKGVSIQ
jgi:hypothetical protein